MKIIKFGTATCAPCKVQTKILERLKEQYKILVVEERDAITDSEIATHYNISCVPTTIILNAANEIVSTFEGLARLEKLQAVLNTMT